MRVRGERGRSRQVGRSKSGTGELAHAWALDLQEQIIVNPLPVTVADPGSDHGRKLVRAFGARLEGEREERP